MSESEEEPAGEGPLAQHRALRAQFEAERVARDATAARFSMVQLTLFVGSAVLAGSGLMRGSAPLLFAGMGTFLAFLVVYFLQSRVILKREAAETRRDIHDRHVKRMTGRLDEIPGPGAMPRITRRRVFTSTKVCGSCTVNWASPPLGATSLPTRLIVERPMLLASTSRLSCSSPTA